MSRKIDETGNRYGKLVVLQEAKTKNPTGGCMWICKCDCGKLVLADGHELRRGKKKSCGCLNNIIDEIGKKYGKLTVIKYAGLNNRGQALWQCKCDCGNTTIVMGINLRNGNSQSCGCLKSKGELKISKLLLKYNIPFQREKKFETCRYDKTNQLAKFDFYINSKYIIEYDGIQHFDFSKGEKTWNTKERLEDTQEKDLFKNQWCKKNNIPLIRIPYTHLKDLSIKDLLLETSPFIVS